MAGQWLLRWARALTLAAVMLAGGISGHVAAGGMAPPFALLGPMLVVATVGVAPYLDAPASSRRVVAVVLAGQGVLHVVLAVVGGSAAAQTAPMTMHSPMASGGSESATVAMMCLTDGHLYMLAAHVGAALLVILWLAAGERAAWTLIGVTTLAVVDGWLIVRSVRSCGWTVAVVSRRARPVSAWCSRRRTLRSVWIGRGGLS